MRCGSGRFVPDPRRVAEAGLTILETTIAGAILAIVAAAPLATLIALNKNASGGRIMTTAHEVVQRNIETAVAVSSPPVIFLRS